MRINYPKQIHYWLYLLGLSCIIVGLPLSKFLMSVGQFILAGNWLLEGDWKRKYKQFVQSKAPIVVVSLFLLHVIGLLYSDNVVYAWKDIRVKIPLFLLPLFISTSPPLDKKTFSYLLGLFVVAVTASSVISIWRFMGLESKEFTEGRELSLFVSHIRFSLMINIAILVVVYYMLRQTRTTYTLLLLIILLWLLTFQLLLASGTGLIILFTVFGILSAYWIKTQRSKLMKVSILSGAILLTTVCIWFIASEIQEFYEVVEQYTPKELSVLTPYGNPYNHYPTERAVENGHYVFLFVCWQELDEEWGKRSSISINGLDKKNNPIRFTLLRYLTSKGLRKDKAGIQALKDEEIKNIEQGATNVEYTQMNALEKKAQETIYELDNYLHGGDPGGHSVTMRFEFWKNALGVAKENLLFGVGTGDVEDQLKQEYIRTDSKLPMKWRLHAHNQYIEILVAFGVIGLLWFLVVLFYPLIALRKWNDYFYLTFLIVFLLSMLNEDTLETQAGSTFYAFLNAFLLWGRKDI